MEKMSELKFTMMIDEIASALSIYKKRDLDRYPSTYKNDVMKIIFDYDKLNSFGKIVYENAVIDVEYLVGKSSIVNEVDELNALNDLEYARVFIEVSNKSHYGIIKGYSSMDFMQRKIFLFLSLLILAVDKNNSEEHLEKICDYAKMLHIPDDGVIDVAVIVKWLLTHSKDELTFKSASSTEIYKCLKGII